MMGAEEATAENNNDTDNNIHNSNSNSSISSAHHVEEEDTRRSSTANHGESSGQQGGSPARSLSFPPPGCGRESAGWIVFGSLCAVLGWAFTDKFGIDDLQVPVQILNGTTDDDADSPFLFFVKDLTFDETHDSDTVSTIMTYILAGLVPILIQSWLAWRYGPPADLGHTVVAYLVAFGTSLLASEPVKWYVSYRRPNFYELCNPTEETSYETCEMIMEHDEEINPREAIFSFPSGHSSTAFTGTTFFALYVHNRFGIPAYRRLVRRRKKKNQRLTTRQEQDTEGTAARPPAAGTPPPPVSNMAARYRVISMMALIFPMALAVFISVSRIVDHRHFPADVIAGALIGVASGGWVHPLWYFYDDYDDDDDDEDF